MTTHHGSCHCGAVRFDVELTLEGKATRCNCSLCTKLSLTGALVKPPQFTLRQGEAALRSYARHPDIAQRFFCATCGTHVFSKGTLAELGGAFVGINVNTLDDVDPHLLTISYWDGRHDNWHAGLKPQPWPIFTSV